MDDEVAEVLREFNIQMKKDRHKERLRAQITRSVIGKWKERVRKDVVGEKSYYRDRKERQRDRQDSKKSDKTNWFKGRGYEGVLKVQSTPDSLLVNYI